MKRFIKATIILAALVTAAGCATQRTEMQSDSRAVQQPGQTNRTDETAPPPATEPTTPAVPETPVITAAVEPRPGPGSDIDSAKVGMLDTVYFAFDSYALTPENRDILARNFERMKKLTGNFVLQGHCDEQGSMEYNLALGEMRAKAAYNYLVTRGFDAGRLSIISFGKEKPADPGHDEAAWARNRRVEIVPHLLR